VLCVRPRQSWRPSRIELQKVALDAGAEDDAVLGHMGVQDERAARVELAKHDVGLRQAAAKRLAHGEVQLVRFPWQAIALRRGRRDLHRGDAGRDAHRPIDNRLEPAR